MAVDYTKTRHYNQAKSSYKYLVDEAIHTDNTNTAKGFFSDMLSYATLGASVGGVAGAFIGGGIGAIINWGTNVISGISRDWVGAEEGKAYQTLNSDITTYTGKVYDAQIARNKAINSAKNYIGQTKSTFNSTYGNNAFNMLEATIQSIMNMDSTTAGQVKLSELLGNLSTDTIIGQIESRVLKSDAVVEEPIKDANGIILKGPNGSGPSYTSTNGPMAEETLNAMSSKYLSLSDLGNEYINYLYSTILSSDNEIADNAAQLSKQEAWNIQELDQSIQELTLSNQQKFAELFLNQRSTNISNAQNLGETEASAGASGIKASKASRTAVNAQRLQADIANASYAIMLNSYMSQLESSLNGGAMQRAQVYYSSRQQMKSLKRQTINAYNQSMNEYAYGMIQSAQTIGDAEKDIDDNMGIVHVAEETLREYDQTPVSYGTQIYTTDTATK